MDITKDTFRKNLVELVKGFIANSDRYGDDPQICVIPADGRLSIMTADEFHESIADSVEELDNASGALGMASADAGDYQATRNPDFYPAWSFVKEEPGSVGINEKAINSTVAVYF